MRVAPARGVRDEAAWLDPTLTDPLAAMARLRAYPAERMEAYPVLPLVNAAANEGRALNERSATA